MHSFDAHYDAEGSARAERAFHVRAIRELRPWSTFGLPALLSVLVAAGSAIGAPGWFLLSFGLLLLASVLVPAFFYFARPRAAARLARQHPVRRISLSAQALTMCVGERSVVVEWREVIRIWEAPGYLLLVVGKFTAVSIPVSSLPTGAREFIESSAKSAKAVGG